MTGEGIGQCIECQYKRDDAGPWNEGELGVTGEDRPVVVPDEVCLLYTSDAADE